MLPLDKLHVHRRGLVPHQVQHRDGGHGSTHSDDEANFELECSSHDYYLFNIEVVHC